MRSGVRDTVNAVPEMMSYSIGDAAHEHGTKVGAEIAQVISEGLDKCADRIESLTDKQLRLCEFQLKLFEYQRKVLMGLGISLGLGVCILIGIVARDVFQ
jgi:hypothetical protein